MDRWGPVPPMDDMNAVARAGIEVPVETQLRLEALRRELGERLQEDPVAVANFGLILEHGRSMLDRQLKCALQRLAERQATVEVLEARVAFLEGRLEKVERRQGGRRWWWWFR